jgi:glucokinase
MVKQVIGVDIGGTNIRAGLVKNGKIFSKIKLRTDAKKGKKALVENIIKAIKSFDLNDISAVGLGVPGLVDIEKGVVRHSPNLPLKNINIVRDIKSKIKKKIYIENDANCFAIAEALYGAGKGKGIVIGLTLGTGFGSGVVINGEAYHGRGHAPELGHTTIKFDGLNSKCGNNGCVESYVSIRGILSQAKGLYIKNPRELFELAYQKNKKALRLWKETGFYLGVAVANFINTFDPDVVVIGGNISKAWNYFSREMKKTIRKRAMIKGVKVVKTKLSGDAGILGAASLCIS